MQNLVVGQIIEGKITGIKKFGAFVEIDGIGVGLVHISEVSSDYVENINDYLTENQVVKVKVLDLSDGDVKKKISLSIRQAAAGEEKKGENCEDAKTTKNHEKPQRNFNSYGKPKRAQSNSFEDMMAKFKKDSDEKMNNLNQRLEGF